VEEEEGKEVWLPDLLRTKRKEEKGLDLHEKERRQTILGMETRAISTICESSARKMNRTSVATNP